MIEELSPGKTLYTKSNYFFKSVFINISNKPLKTEIVTNLFDDMRTLPVIVDTGSSLDIIDEKFLSEVINKDRIEKLIPKRGHTQSKNDRRFH